MTKEHRKNPRRSLRYNARIFTTPKQSLGCVFSDISDSGARLVVDDAAQLPDRFLLLLSARGGARRVCEVVWRNENQVGVKFAYRDAEAAHASAPVKAPAVAE